MYRRHPGNAVAAALDAGFRRRVLASLADNRPGLPHDQAMAAITKVIAEAAASVSSDTEN